jgi:uncharacterized SAM-binding protein YcdF (DUF218 family)
MTTALSILLKHIFLPPWIFLFIAIAYMIKSLVQKIPFSKIGLTSIIIFYGLSTPFVSTKLINYVEDFPYEKIGKNPPQAIVILSAGYKSEVQEYPDHETVDFASLERLRYGARLAKEKNLPVLVTGGKLASQNHTMADLMAEALKADFSIGVKWHENQALTTFENAVYSKKILEKENITSILLVTHAYHMPRSVYIFKKVGFDVTAAPTIHEYTTLSVHSFLPSSRALRRSYLAFHEIVGFGWYWQKKAGSTR